MPLPGIPDEFMVPDGARARIGCGFSTSSWSFRRRYEPPLRQADAYSRHGRLLSAPMGIPASVPGALHVPLLIEAGEWREIAQGIEQRARLLVTCLADITARKVDRRRRFARRRRHRQSRVSAPAAWREAAGRQILAYLCRRYRAAVRMALVGPLVSRSQAPSALATHSPTGLSWRGLSRPFTAI